MPSQKSIPVIGVVGGIGAGKSFFAQTLAKRKNVVIVDGDAVGHAVLKRPDIRDRIRDRFGDAVLSADGTINRRAVGQLVFGNTPEHALAKTDLEAIVHPPLAAELHRQIQATQSAGQADAIILDAAVLLEVGWRKFCNAVVMLEAPTAVRFQRVQARGWSRTEFEARESNQWPLDQKRAAADYVVKSDGPEEEVAEKYLQVFERIMDETP